MNSSLASIIASGPEVQILELAALGHTDKRISVELGISPLALVGHWREILLRNQRASRTQVVARFAMDKRLSEGKAPRLQDEIQSRSLATANELAQRNLLEAITNASLGFVSGRANLRQVFSRCLSEFVGLTASEYGFLGEILASDDGAPYLKLHVVTSISGSIPSREFFDRNAPTGYEFHNLKTLFGGVITTHKPVIANEALTDPRRAGIPPGHPPLDCFLGLPVLAGQELIGMVGLANRPEGYNDEIVQYLMPLVATVASFIVGLRADAERLSALRDLEEAASFFKKLSDQVPEPVL
ncbi:MAG: GAF domain-containing protein [Fimbriimonas sp.]